MSTHSPTLNVHDLVIRRGDTHIHNGLSWRVEAGESWAIVGANGSGKTSLLNTLTGILQPTSGTVQLFGETFGETDWKPLRNKVGIVNHTIADWINNNETAVEIAIGGIYNQINYWGEITREDYDQAMAMLDRYGLAYAWERVWEQLSQGERQRVLIVRALLAEFRLLILDEPCAGLDPVARGSFLEFMDQLIGQESAPAMLLVTHHVEEITPRFTHVLLLKQGRAFAAGPKEDILTSERLSEAFDAKLKLTQASQGYRLELLHDPSYNHA